jgi:hypothetical protein
MHPPLNYKMTPKQARDLHDYLERQESIKDHDTEAYRFHSGASFVLKTLGISLTHVKWLAEER